MDNIETFSQPYIELEIAIRESMGALFSDTCGICTACCCRADICEETTQSAFLSLLLEMQERSFSDMDDRYGWLDLHGCSLEYGRPPVCYTYFCDELLARLPDEDTRWVTRVLGRLLEYVGENAAAGWHLVEVQQRSGLEEIDFATLSSRLETAHAAFESIEQFFTVGRLDLADREAFEAIGIGDN